jgi:isopentenyl diphosphate isomerase/L-lactate dehydrogenase-like FMN-dependent dehydrogenase
MPARYSDIVSKGLERIRSAGMAAYLDLGAETRSQNRLNRQYIDSIVFEMRILGSTLADTKTELFGQALTVPILAAALCKSRVLERLGPWEIPYLEQIAAGLADAGSMMSTGGVELDELARIVDQGAPVVHIVKPYGDDDLILRHLQRAAELGCVAVGMDIDAFFQEKAWDEEPGPADWALSPKSLDDMRRYCRETTLPFVVKGVLSVHDALRAQDIGASAVVVSFHGGEAIDYAVPILKILPAIREAVPELTIMVDSGFRRGTDVLKALALGADGVGIATLLLIACAADGRAGVKAMIELLAEELQRTMSLVGSPSVAQVDRSTLHFVGQETRESDRPNALADKPDFAAKGA